MCFFYNSSSETQIIDLCFVAQVGIFSATMPNPVLDLARKVMKNPVQMLVKPPEYSLIGVRQYYVAIEKEEYRLPTLYDLFDYFTIRQAIIYVNCQRKAVWLKDKFASDLELSCDCIHDGLSKEEKESMVKEFKKGDIRCLIATDGASTKICGINGTVVSVAINYELPENKECYIRRVGSGNHHYGRRGNAISFCTDDEEPKLLELEQFYNTKVDELPTEPIDM